MLPHLARQETLSKAHVTTFAGYDHNPVVRNGFLYHMENLTADQYPVLAPRKGRLAVEHFQTPNGLSCKGRLCWVDGTGFYYDGVCKGQVTDGPKQLAHLGNFVLIFPDKAYFNSETGVFGTLEASWTGTATLTHYTHGAESPEAAAVYQGNAITTQTKVPLEAGEAVVLTGSGLAENNRTAVIRSIVNDGKTLVFSNHTFTERGAETLTLARTVPDLDFFCENENRLWGCHGNEIRACALGNPFRWNNFEGLVTDSYAVTVGSEGAFTGACTYLGYAIFFKEEAIHKIYGGKPANFQAMSSAVSGVAEGSGASLAVAGETLFYLSRTGVMSYSGGVPVSIAAPFGGVRYDQAVGGSDGPKYYVSLRSGAEWTLFVYDTRSGLWHREDATQAVAFARQDGVLYLLSADKVLYSLETGTYEAVAWMAETGDFTDGGPNKTGAGKLQLRLEADPGTTVQVDVQFDSDGIWKPIRQVTSTHKRTYRFPILPRRCDHYRLRISGVGGGRVFSLTRQVYKGSDV